MRQPYTGDRELGDMLDTSVPLKTTHKVWYIVSDSPDRIDPVNEGPPDHYDTPEDAGDSIVTGYHGELGTRYVLAVDVSVVATWDRPWALTLEDPRTT